MHIPTWCQQEGLKVPHDSSKVGKQPSFINAQNHMCICIKYLLTGTHEHKYHIYPQAHITGPTMCVTSHLFVNFKYVFILKFKDHQTMQTRKTSITDDPDDRQNSTLVH